MKSSTIWVSLETKKKADSLRGKKSYNKHYSELMDMYKKGILRNKKTEMNGDIIKKIKEEIHNEIVESLSITGMNPLFYEELKNIVKQTIHLELQSKFQIPAYCRNCGYPIFPYNVHLQAEKKRKKSIFTMLL